MTVQRSETDQATQAGRKFQQLRIPMKRWLGGLGGAATVGANLLIIDIPTLDAYLWAIWNGDTAFGAGAHLLGYCFRGVVFFLVGMLWLAMHSTPSSLFQSFQLGVLAPALFLGYIAEANEKTENAKEQIDRSAFDYESPALSTQFSLASAALAQENDSSVEIPLNSSDHQSFWRNLYQGFMGQPLEQTFGPFEFANSEIAIEATVTERVVGGAVDDRILWIYTYEVANLMAEQHLAFIWKDAGIYVSIASPLPPGEISASSTTSSSPPVFRMTTLVYSTPLDKVVEFTAPFPEERFPDDDSPLS